MYIRTRSSDARWQSMTLRADCSSCALLARGFCLSCRAIGLCTHYNAFASHAQATKLDRGNPAQDDPESPKGHVIFTFSKTEATNKMSSLHMGIFGIFSCNPFALGPLALSLWVTLFTEWLLSHNFPGLTRHPLRISVDIHCWLLIALIPHRWGSPITGHPWDSIGLLLRWLPTSINVHPKMSMKEAGHSDSF